MNEQQALLRAQNLCSRSEHCEHDIIILLTRWGIPPSAHTRIIRNLRQHRFIDDSRYASAFARDKARFNKWGPLKINAALRAKHIPDDAIRQALESLDHELSAQSLSRLLQHKIKQLRTSDRNLRQQKLLRFALSRGFTLQQAYSALQSLTDNSQDMEV